MSSLNLPVTGKPEAVAQTASNPPRSLSTRWISTLTLATLLLVWWLVTAAGWPQCYQQLLGAQAQVDVRQHGLRCAGILRADTLQLQ